MDIIDYKTVLVSLGQRTRVVTFAVGGSSIDTLEKAIRGAFADSPVLSTKCRVIIQVCIVHTGLVRRISLTNRQYNFCTAGMLLLARF